MYEILILLRIILDGQWNIIPVVIIHTYTQT